MALTDDITLAGDASSSTTYALINRLATSSLRRDASATIGSPKAISVSHATGKDAFGQPVDRHVVRLDRTEADSLNLKHTGSVYVVLVQPASGVTEAHIKDMRTQLKNFLSDANVDKVLNGEL